MIRLLIPQIVLKYISREDIVLIYFILFSMSGIGIPYAWKARKTGSRIAVFCFSTRTVCHRINYLSTLFRSSLKPLQCKIVFVSVVDLFSPVLPSFSSESVLLSINPETETKTKAPRASHPVSSFVVRRNITTIYQLPVN